MRFVITGEWDRNRLLQVIVVLYVLYVGGLWVTNTLLYFNKMNLAPSSVAEYYLGDEDTYREPKSYQGMLEVSHYHLFAMGMLLLVLTHLMLFVPLGNGTRALLIVVPFVAALVDEGASWGIRYLGAGFAWVKVAGFLTLQLSLAALMAASLWAVFAGSQENYETESIEDHDFDDEDSGPAGPTS